MDGETMSFNSQREFEFFIKSYKKSKGENKMLNKLSVKDLRTALKIAEQDRNCHGVICNDCPYTGEDCYKESSDLLAELLKEELKRRETAANRRKLTLEINVKGMEELREVMREFKRQARAEEELDRLRKAAEFLYNHFKGE
jgi:hypothetical protein